MTDLSETKRSSSEISLWNGFYGFYLGSVSLVCIFGSSHQNQKMPRKKDLSDGSLLLDGLSQHLF